MPIETPERRVSGLRTTAIRMASASLGAFALASCVPGPVGVDSAPRSAQRSIPAEADPNGPQGDYPVVLGEAFTIDGITYTPSDTLNFDQVGYATLDESAGPGITASHRTLPLPSYVEVTSLDSGRTILVRVERRGPMTNSRMLALSPEAATQLGVSEGAPVRVRRVNPVEPERAALRRDEEAAQRMDTPPGLLEVLKRKLPVVGSASLARDEDASAPNAAITSIDPDNGSPTRSVTLDDEVTAPGPAEPEPVVEMSEPEVPASTTNPDGRYVVQAGAYSSKPAAQRVADSIGGYLEPVGRLWRVRVGPFATRGQAGEALAKVRSAGYSGAQIVSR